MMGVQEIHYIFFVQQVSFKTTVNNHVFVVAAKSSKGMLYNFSNVYGIYNFRIRYYIYTKHGVYIICAKYGVPRPIHRNTKHGTTVCLSLPASLFIMDLTTYSMLISREIVDL